MFPRKIDDSNKSCHGNIKCGLQQVLSGSACPEEVRTVRFGKFERRRCIKPTKWRNACNETVGGRGGCPTSAPQSVWGCATLTCPTNRRLYFTCLYRGTHTHILVCSIFTSSYTRAHKPFTLNRTMVQAETISRWNTVCHHKLIILRRFEGLNAD